ncbi:MAG: Rieske 2Fe-2S domain-containing protein [Micromonosporaceae bacterium]|nr:Rieske 2Fe-2S domain-containing protein [Micromonosporaceae bacterium]
MSAEPLRQRQAGIRIRIAFIVATLAGAAFAVCYAVDAGEQALGLTIALAFGSIAYGLGAWARLLLPTGGYVQSREPSLRRPREESLLIQEFTEEPSPVNRRSLLGLLGLAGTTIGAALLFPLRSLYPPGQPAPLTELRQTPWRFGPRLVTTDGQPVRPTMVTTEATLTVLPEGNLEAGDAPAFVVRVPGPGQDGGTIHAYSLLCTHAGCPVALYESTTARVLCPCHQSVFDLRDAAKPIAGPAARPLPALPIAVDADGFLRATGDFTSPPGPGFWGR